MGRSMIIGANKCLISAGELLLWWVVALTPAFAADSCDNNSGYVDYRQLGFEAQGHMYSDCVDRGQILRGHFYEDDLRDIRPSTSNRIHIEPNTPNDNLNLASLAQKCLSRMYFDIVCKRNERLFTSPVRLLNQCPLSLLYAPSEIDIMNFALSQLFGARGYCSSFSTRFVPNALKIGPGKTTRLYLRSSEFGIVTGPVTVLNMSAQGAEFADIVISGDLTISDSSFRYLDLNRLVILGDLRIERSTLTRLTVASVWVKGDFFTSQNSFGDDESGSVALKGVKVAGQLTWSDNKLVGKDLSIMRVDGVDIQHAPILRENRYAGPNLDRHKEVERFERALREASTK